MTANFTTTLFCELQKILPQHFISKIAGLFAQNETPWLKNALIRAFIQQFKVDLTDAVVQNPEDFKSFNAFFTRQLKPNTRPIDPNLSHFVSPADGLISHFGTTSEGRLIQAKGQHYSVKHLLDNDPFSANFEQSAFATIYLSPKDYHRVHMPCAAKLIKTTWIPGDLFSVNLKTCQGIENLFGRNERLIAYFETEWGSLAMVLVGAMVVGGIRSAWAPQPSGHPSLVFERFWDRSENLTQFKKGEEFGYFELGSTVVLLASTQSLNLSSNTQQNQSLPIQFIPHLSEGQNILMGQNIAQLTTENLALTAPA
jgi:phosphatidylserine decarboxylase